MLNQILMYLMAAGVILGGADRMLGNRFGLGEKFEEGFRLMGPIALSMVGIICLSPVIAAVCEGCVRPLFLALGIDPAICGGILPLDVGGYQLAMALALDETVGQYAGIVVGATFGCTVAFVIPVGMGALDDAGKEDFAMGLLVGLITLPVPLLLGGVLAGLSVSRVVYQSLPILLLCGILLLALRRCREKLIRCFVVFARLIQIVATLGLMVGAVEHLTGGKLVPAALPLSGALETVGSIAIVLLGSLPLSELLKRALRGPALRVGRKTGLNTDATTGLLVGFIIAMPVLTALKNMDRRGRVVNGALLVCGASAFSAHLGFALGVSPDLVGPMLAAKITGGILAAVVALWVTDGPADSGTDSLQAENRMIR